MTAVRIFLLGLFPSLLLGWGCVAVNSAQAAEVILVCPDPFRSALDPWVQHRADEGLSVVICGVASDPADQQQRIARLADSSTRYVMLVGDAPAVGQPCRTAHEIPTCYEQTTVTAEWGSTAALASDFRYGDFDSDGKPDAAVGRLPVDNRGQLNRLIERILAYETSSDFGPWRGQVQLTGGVGGFGALADAAIESVTRSVITTVLPAETKTRVAYASPGHPFFPTGKSFTDAVLDRYQQGSRFWVYAGHGWVNQLDRVPATPDGVPVLDSTSVERLRREASGAPIAVLLACYTGAIDARQDSLAEQMLLADGGPIAVIAGSRVTMPYGNATTAVGMIESVYHSKVPRLGDAWLSTLNRMNLVDESPDKSMTRMLIDTVAAFCSPSRTTLLDERREHMRLYNLIGDPTLKLHQPGVVQLSIVAKPVAGQSLALQMSSPIEGDLTLTVDRPLGLQIDGESNRGALAAKRMRVLPQQVLKPELELPPGTQGPVVVRAMVSGITGWATGAIRLNVR